MKIGANDLFFLLLSFGGKAAIITYEYALDEDIREKELKDAVRSAVKAFPLYGLTPVVDKNGHIFMEETNEELPVYPDDGNYVCLGSTDTGGYLFRVTYKDNRLVIAVSHALGDGRGIMSFTVTLLYHYLINTGYIIDPQGMIYTPEDAFDPAVTVSLAERIKKVDVLRDDEPKTAADPFFFPGGKDISGDSRHKKVPDILGQC